MVKICPISSPALVEQHHVVATVNEIITECDQLLEPAMAEALKSPPAVAHVVNALSRGQVARESVHRGDHCNHFKSCNLRVIADLPVHRSVARSHLFI